MPDDDDLVLGLVPTQGNAVCAEQLLHFAGHDVEDFAR